MTTSGRSGSAQPWMIVLPTKQQRESWIQILQIANYCSLNGKRKMHLYTRQNVFLQMEKCICSNGKMYLYTWQNVFFQMHNHGLFAN